MESEYGHPLVKGYAKVYESADRMKQIEPKYVLERNVMPEEPEPAEEEADAENAEEADAENTEEAAE